MKPVQKGIVFFMASPLKYTIVGLGELLWDVFPNRKELGGAPANFAYMTSLLGDEGVVASRVGRDRLGNAAARRLAKLGLSQEWLQIDTQHPTGTVKVDIAADGQPKFQIAEHVAWDFFEWTPQWQVLGRRCRRGLLRLAGATLAEVRERPILSVPASSLRPALLKVFDVNLRQCFFFGRHPRESATLADIMKVNR